MRKSDSPRRLDAAALWEYALRLLSARSRSGGQMRQKLLDRAERSEDVSGVLARLKEYGYIDDKLYAEGFSSARLENEGFGKDRVLRDLAKRRVAPSVARKAVERVYAETDETGLIEQFLRRKYRAVKLEEWLAEPKNLASAYRRLRMAGFGASNAIRVLKRFAAEPEALDGWEDLSATGEE